MADSEKEVVEGTTTPRGADWEVVTLTASAYAAAPGPDGRPTAGARGMAASNSSDPLLMSDHFVFPLNEHENLPIQTSFDEIQPEKDAQEVSTSVEDFSFKNMGAKNDPVSERIEFYDEGRNLSVADIETRDDTPEYGSAHAEDGGRGFVAHDKGNEAGGESDEKLSQPSKSADSKSGDAGDSCKCWLKKHMTCLYHQAKETNAIWSVVVAAALVGIVILGRWHKDKLHINPLKWCSGSAVRFIASPMLLDKYLSRCTGDAMHLIHGQKCLYSGTEVVPGLDPGQATASPGKQTHPKRSMEWFQRTSCT